MRRIDELALQAALGVHRRAHRNQCSGLTGTWTECLFNNVADYSAVASTSSEASLLSGVAAQPVIPALFFAPGGGQGIRRSIKIQAKGVLGTTGTPTIIFQARLGTTVGSASLAGTSVGVTAAITTASGVTNQQWGLELDLTCNTPGLSTTNLTLSGAGFVWSPGGFASPFTYAIQPTTPPTATWTATIDGSLTQYLNLSVTWGTSNASNTCTLKQLLVFGLN